MINKRKNSEYSPEEPYVHPFVPPENDTDTIGTGVIFGSWIFKRDIWQQVMIATAN